MKRETVCLESKGDTNQSVVQTAFIGSVFRNSQSPSFEFPQQNLFLYQPSVPNNKKTAVEFDMNGDETVNSMSDRDDNVKSALVQTIFPISSNEASKDDINRDISDAMQSPDQLQEGSMWQFEAAKMIEAGHQVSTCSQTDELMVQPTRV